MQGSHQSHRASAIGMWLFLAALAMLFLASMFGYLLIRTHRAGTAISVNLSLPRGMWISTLVLLAGSFTLHRAVYNVRLERLDRLDIWLQMSLWLAVLFLVIQFPCLWKILEQHRLAQAAQTQRNGFYGLIFCLILLHALHVIGGVIYIALVTIRAIRRRYDHENYLGVRHAALYWHFLDIIWLMMFTMFNLTA